MADFGRLCTSEVVEKTYILIGFIPGGLDELSESVMSVVCRLGADLAIWTNDKSGGVLIRGIEDNGFEVNVLLVGLISGVEFAVDY